MRDHRAWRRWLLVAGGLFACRDASSAASVAPGLASDTPADEASTTPSEATATCGAPDERVDEYGWLPMDAEVAASVDLRTPDHDASLSVLSGHARSPDAGLPIEVAFALGQWSWQVPLVVSTLASIGLQPAELVYARLASGTSAWVFVSTCDFAEATARMRRTWGIEVRTTSRGAIGAHRDGNGRAFAYDVVFLPADRIALVPAGSATEFESALVARHEGPGLADDGVDSTVPVGARLQEVAAAPIRVVVAPGVRVGRDPSPSTILRVDGSEVSRDTTDPSAADGTAASVRGGA